MKKIIKSIYNYIPFKKELYLALKRNWKPRESLYKHLHFKESFSVKIDFNKSFDIYNETQIENEIFWEGLTGKWEKESMKLWIKLSEISACIFDIGSNTGVYALVAKTINPESRVFAFEPHPLFFNMLEKNIELNDYEIMSLKKAVSDVDGKIKIEDYSGASSSINVESVSLDKFIDDKKIEKVDLLKIDVETFEPQVIKGFEKYLSLHHPTLLIEILNEDVAKSINDLIGNIEYLYFNIDERGGVRQTEKIEKSDYYNYLICEASVAKKIGLIKKDL